MYEQMMQAVADETGAAARTGPAAQLLGGQEPSAEEEAWWSAERMRCAQRRVTTRHPSPSDASASTDSPRACAVLGLPPKTYDRGREMEAGRGCHGNWARRRAARRCLEELGSWDQLLRLVDLELDSAKEDAAAGPSLAARMDLEDAAGRADAARMDLQDGAGGADAPGGKDDLLFETREAWRGPEYLRCAACGSVLHSPHLYCRQGRCTARAGVAFSQQGCPAVAVSECEGVVFTEAGGRAQALCARMPVPAQ
jgi:hypothetical protein